MLDVEAASVVDLKLGKWEGADTAIAVEAEWIFQMSASGVEETVLVVGDGNFFPRINIPNYMNGFTLCIAVPIIVSIWKTAVINKTNDRKDATNHEAGTAGQSVGFDNAAERMFVREIVMKQKELSLLNLE